MTKIYMDNAALTKAIASIKGRGAKLDKDIHEAALSCLNNVVEHNNTTMSNALLAAMPKSSRRLALQSWFVAFGKMQANIDNKTNKLVPLVFNREGKNDMAGATETPFYEYTKEAEPKSWDFDTFNKGVLKTLQNQATKRGTDGELTPEALKASAAFALLSGGAA